MTRSETDRKLHAMRLSTMANEYQRQSTDRLVLDLPFEDRFQMLVDLEYQARTKRKLDRLLRQSGILNRDACISDMYYGEERNLHRATVERYASCIFLSERRNVLVMGPTGCGKTYFSSALGIEACKREYSVRFVSLDELLIDIEITEKDPHLGMRVLKHYRQPDLLIIDEFLRWKLSSIDANRLFKIVDFRIENKKPLLICSQYPCSEWVRQIDDQVNAEALVDRLIHTPYKLFINEDGRGKSMREIYSA
jgi:DNA replication protein DnaC